MPEEIQARRSKVASLWVIVKDPRDKDEQAKDGLRNQVAQRLRDQDDSENRSRYCKEYSQRVYNINGSIRCR
jgi:hypothetical protein